MCKCLPACTITHTAIDIAAREEPKVDNDTPSGMLYTTIFERQDSKVELQELTASTFFCYMNYP